MCSSLVAYDLFVNPAANPSLADGSFEYPFTLIQSAVNTVFNDSLSINQHTTSARIILLGDSIFSENIVLNYSGESGPHRITDVAIIGDMYGQERRTIAAPVLQDHVITMIIAGDSSLRLDGLEIRHAVEPLISELTAGIFVTTPSQLDSGFDSLSIENCHFDYSHVAVGLDNCVAYVNQIHVIDSSFIQRHYAISDLSSVLLSTHGHGSVARLNVSGSSFAFIRRPTDPLLIDHHAIVVSKMFGNVEIEGNVFEGSDVEIFNEMGSHNTCIKGNRFLNASLRLGDAGTWVVEKNEFINTDELRVTPSIMFYTAPHGYGLEPAIVRNNIFTNSSLAMEMIKTGVLGRSRSFDIRNNSFIACGSVLKLWNQTINGITVVFNNIGYYINNLYLGTSNSPFESVQQDGYSLELPDEARIPISHSHFSTHLAQNLSLILDDTVSYGDPLIDYDETTHSYSLLWDATQKSPLINSGYPGENGELTDPDGTPPDIGYVFYPHVNHKYFERVSAIKWLSFPVLDDRSNTEGTYWNELGYMFEEQMQGPPIYTPQLNRIQWSYDGQRPTMMYINSLWQYSESRVVQQKGYKVQFNTPGAISDIVVNGFRAEVTTPVAWLAEIEENGQSRPFENWIGYFVPFRQKAGNAFSHLLPGSNRDGYLDYIYSMKTQYWSTSRQTADHDSPWIIDPNKYTLSEGDMVSLILLPDAPQEMYWENPAINVAPRETAKPTAFSYEEKLDYKPVYIEFDPEDMPQEIGLFVGDECMGAAVVDSTRISVCLYNDSFKAEGELELVFYYEGRGKSVSEGWTVYNPQSLVFENRGIRADRIGDYAFISFDREEGDSPAPIVSSLRQNYPNPCNPSTTISFVLGTESEASLEIFNTRGQLIRSFPYDRLARGLYTVDWDGKDNSGRAVSSGLYFYRLRTPEASFVRKMLLLK